MLRQVRNALMVIGLFLGLIHAATVSGVVTDSTTGKALSGAVVSYGFGLGATRDTTGADGSYSLSGNMGGIQTITVSLKGYTTKT